ncbi:hypothetical protein [Burkholderia sola]|uniref:hypothetical protein n=1 Tax=Burkholderia sola TaxID=2843302 RepID=UPI00338E300C
MEHAGTDAGGSGCIGRNVPELTDCALLDVCDIDPLFASRRRFKPLRRNKVIDDIVKQPALFEEYLIGFAVYAKTPESPPTKVALGFGRVFVQRILVRIARQQTEPLFPGSGEVEYILLEQESMYRGRARPCATAFRPNFAANNQPVIREPEIFRHLPI